MKTTKVILGWMMSQYGYIVLSIVFLFLVCTKVQAQASYDIRLSQQYTNIESGSTCFEVQIKSGTQDEWELGGQNYRLYYDASKATFSQGKSLLGNKYQSFNLVQNLEHVDASDVKGNLTFEKDLGFLNYAIDLIDATETALIVPTQDTWLSTSEICFHTDNLSDSLEDFSLVWARNGTTDAYATSFVEISNRTGINELAASSGNKYQDLVGTKVQAQASYDIRLSQQYMNTESGTTCFEVQIKSGTTDEWELGGQNYRLYYDASKATFSKGKSLLGNKYQSFKLVQNLEHVDASDVKGNLTFEKDLGFLNYAIDLIDATETALIVPAENTWLSTSEICFHSDDSLDSLEDFSLVWARSGTTDTYATSFVEISNRIGINQLAASNGNKYQDLLSNKKIELKAKIFLQGPYNKDTGLMNDDLRQKYYVPLSSPYHKAKFKDNPLFKIKNNIEESIDIEVLNASGDNAIVDWVFLELRSKKDTGIVVTRSALLQRDGDIVDIDGKSAVEFPVLADAYFLIIRHRNHLGLMTAAPINLSARATKVIDFTDINTAVYGDYARKEEGGIAMLWGGNADNNNFLVFQGGGISLPDSEQILHDVFSDTTNTSNLYNHIIDGYLDSDLNMDGEVRYQGVGNEIYDLLFYNIFSHPANTDFFSNFFITEEIPSRTK